MPKITRDGSRYYYYAFAPQHMLPEDRQLVERALQLLHESSFEVQGRRVPGDLLPFNLIAVRPQTSTVSFLWYTGFWVTERPVRLYYVTVNVASGTVRGPVVSRRFEPLVSSRSTPNYLHHKEEMVHGLEALAANPYANCMSLERRLVEKRDEWVNLPWSVKVIVAEDINELLEILRGAQLEKPLKLIAYIGSVFKRDKFTRLLAEKLTCRNNT